MDTENMEGDHGWEFPGPKNRLALTFGEPEPLPEMESEPLQLSFGELESEPELEAPSLTLGGGEPEPESPSLTLGGGEPESEGPVLQLGGLETEPPTTMAYVPLSGVESVDGGEELESQTLNLGIVGEPVAEITPPDNTTVQTYSVMFYYTAEVAADTADLEGFFDQVIAETNAGYENSEIPLRIKKHCSAQLPSSFPELGASSLLNNITYWNSNPATTRNGADVAAVISLNLDYCGVAWFDQLSSGYTFSVTKKSCATGYYSFGHEIGHNIGAQHNPEASTNSKFSYGHGHLIAQGTANTGARTIMAYSATGHSTRVNYWSNPNVNHPTTGTPTGVATLSNNAALLTLRRYTLASIADESTGGCYASSTTSAPGTNAPPATTAPPATNAPPATTLPPATNAPPATTLPPPPPVTTAGPPPSGTPSPGPILCNKMIKGVRAKKTKASSAEDCQEKCQKAWNKGCIAFNFFNPKSRCDLLLLQIKNNKKYCSGRPWA